jgi:RHS repeat-associated protein
MVVSNHRFLYRGYLQIAALDLTRTTLNELWFITWDPTEPVATRPLAIQKDGTWYTYGLDLPKNITEVYGTDGYIKTAYTYSPYGLVTSTGSVTQPIQWSCEYHDTDLALVYYNYRHCNPLDGRWCGRDLARISEVESLYCYIQNAPVANHDINGLIIDIMWDIGNVIWDVGTIVYGAATGDSEMVQNGTTDLAIDTLAVLIPGVPAGASKAARAVAKKTTSKAINKGTKKAKSGANKNNKSRPHSKKCRCIARSSVCCKGENSMGMIEAEGFGPNHKLACESAETALRAKSHILECRLKHVHRIPREGCKK